jgi:hypothetical protein
MAKGPPLRAAFEQRKLFASVLKIAAVFLSRFCPKTKGVRRKEMTDLSRSFDEKCL